MEKQNNVEIARSFSRKVNIGNYQTLDFFCSAKMEVAEKDFKKTSVKLDKLVQGEVELSVRNWQMENMAKPKEELTYEPIKPPTKEEAEALDRETERIIAEGISNQEKAKLEEAENKKVVEE